MRRDEILSTLSSHRKELRKFGVTSIGIIGSAARDELEPSEDLELIVEFDPDAHVGLFGFVRLERHLSQLFGRTVVLGELARGRGVCRVTEHGNSDFRTCLTRLTESSLTLKD